jgi:hypothetical protein
MVGLNIEVGGGVAVLLKGSTGKLNADAKSLHEAEYFQRFSQVWITVVGDTWLSEVLAGDLAVRPPGVLNLDAVAEPSDPYGGVGRLVVSVHHGIADKLLKCI